MSEIDRLAKRRLSAFLGMVLVALALASAVATFITLAGFVPAMFGDATLVVLFAINFALIALLLIVVAREGYALWRAKRSGAAGAKLHSRIMRWFSFVATFPAVVMALVAYVTLDRGLEPWFSSTVRDVITGSSEIAKAYTESQCRTMSREIGLMAGDIDRAKPIFDQDRDLFKRFVTSRANYLEFPVTMLVQKDLTVLERIETATVGEVAAPTAQEVEMAADGEPWCLVPREGNIFRVIFKLSAYNDIFLYGARPVDPRAIEFPRIADAGLNYYRVLEERKASLQVAFATMYALVALIVLLSAAWLGLNFANRLVAPIRRLIAATDRVASGDYAVAVPVRTSEGDLAHLGQTFNKMTSELQLQHERLTAAAEIIDQRRRFTETVLSGVSAGVIGVDHQGTITVVNPSAEKLLNAKAQTLVGQPLASVEPKLAAITAGHVPTRGRQTQHHMSLVREGREQLLNVRLTADQSNEDAHGLIMTLDDITDLVTAQRTSAWADVARRIAHEIKNPLTPIQLSVERIRRKYGKNIGEDRQVFDQCTDTIIRQVDGIKKMVDEFSSFARMPKPKPELDDLSDMVREVVFLMRVGYPDVTIDMDLPDNKMMAQFDRRLLGQALTNIVKNATESVNAVEPQDRGGPGKISIVLHRDEAASQAIIDVTDNGIGFPPENRQRLLEPYMTTRATGTGLGLPIVGKILEDHGGGIELLDNPAGRGACVRMRIATDGDGQAATEADEPGKKTEFVNER